MSIDNLTTEQRNPASEHIDELTTLEIVRLMNDEDRRVADAVRAEETNIARAIDVIAEKIRNGGRLIYIGAGTSGRLGVLDASECPPTFNTRPEQVVGIIAGGPSALTRSIEGAEDHPEYAVRDLSDANVSPSDCVVGIATSGRTPYVVRGLQFAKEVGAAAIGFSCNTDSELRQVADFVIEPVVGPEVVSGSTRLKAGTATKLVLNMLTTGAMVRLGKTYGNLMVDLRASNEKLKLRTKRIVCQLTDITETAAEELLDRCDGELKTAIVTRLLEITPDEARERLERGQQHLRRALQADGE